MAYKKTTTNKSTATSKKTTTKPTTSAKKPAEKTAKTKKRPKYVVTVAKRNREYGSASFAVGCVDTITEAREVVKRNSRDGDLYKISKAGTDTYKKENQVEVGSVHGSGKSKVCQKGYNYRTGQF